jgi:hypothetical protein
VLNTEEVSDVHKKDVRKVPEEKRSSVLNMGEVSDVHKKGV